MIQSTPNHVISCPDYNLSPHYVEQILMAYNCNRVMSNEDSRIMGQALGVLQRHADQYIREIQDSVVRNRRLVNNR